MDLKENKALKSIHSEKISLSPNELVVHWASD